MEHSQSKMEKSLHIFVDESGTDESAEVIYMSLVMTDDSIDLRTKLEQAIESIKKDPEISENISSIRDKGLTFFHYTSDHIEVKNHLITLMPNLNFDSYVIFARKKELTRNLTKTSLLQTLLENALAQRLLEHSYKDIFVVYEKFDEGSKSIEINFESQLEQLIAKLTNKYSREFKNVSIKFQNKSELCLSIADYICGIVSAYINKQLQTGKVLDSAEERNYYRISGKVRLIHDLTRKKYYSRRNPLDIEHI